MNTKRLVTALILTVGMVIIAVVVFTYSPASQAQEAPLAQLAIQASDIESFAGKVMHAGPFSADDMHQPLSRSNGAFADAEASLFNFEEGYSIGGVIYDGEATGYAANYLYRYATDEQSQLAGKVVSERLGGAPGAKALDLSLESSTVQSGQAFVVEGSEGDVVYWVVAAKGRTLNLLILNGPGASEAAARVFSTLTVRNLER